MKTYQYKHSVACGHGMKQETEMIGKLWQMHLGKYTEEDLLLRLLTEYVVSFLYFLVRCCYLKGLRQSQYLINYDELYWVNEVNALSSGQ